MSGNHEDAPKDVIKTEGRIERLSQIKSKKKLWYNQRRLLEIPNIK